jgi:hypothetical protein
MRTFLAFVIVMCLIGGAYLLGGPAFFWPDRWDPSQGVFLSGLSSQLLGAGLLLVSGLGVMAARQAGHACGRAAPRRWQIRFFVLIVLALALISGAFAIGERGPNPDWRAPAANQPA